MSWHRNKCVVASCQATLRQYPNRKFFEFPSKPSEKRDKWLDMLKDSAEKIGGRKRPYICSMHFEGKFMGKRRLKRNAYPSLFLNDSEDAKYEDDNACDVSFDPSKVIRTYGQKYKMNDENFNVDELNSAAIVLDRKAKENAEESLCSRCNNAMKKEGFYFKKIQNLQKKIKNFKIKENIYRKKWKLTYQTNLRLKKKNSELKTKLKLNCIYNALDMLDVNENSKIFAKMILNINKQNAYNDNEKWISQCIYFRSSSGYKFLREVLGFRLPSVTSLHNWIKLKCLAPGFHKSLLDEVSAQISKLSDPAKNVALIFDEMSIQKNLTYNQYKDQIEGFIDYGDNDRENTLSSSVCVFMIRSLCGKFKQVLCYLACSSNIPAYKLQKQIEKCIDVCNNLKLNVKAIVCDQGPSNRKFFNDNKISAEHPFFSYNDQTIPALFDVCHLLKSFRNNLLSSDLNTPDGIVSWQIIRFLYEAEKNATTKMCPKLTSSHIDPTEFQKMNVSLAAQVLSRSVAKGIQCLVQLGKFEGDLLNKALPTATFIEKVDRLFDMLNGKYHFAENSDNLDFLLYMKSYIGNIKPVSRANVYCFKGMQLTITAVSNISQYVFNSYEYFSYFQTKKLNQDPLENFFSQVRARNVNKSNPTLFEFSSIFAKILSLKLIYVSKLSNCEEDEDEILDIDWKAVLEGYEKNNTVNYSEEINNSIEEEYINFNHENDDVESGQIELTDVGARYFAGYCVYKKVKNSSKPVCNKCVMEMIHEHSKDADISSILITLRQYKDPTESGGLTYCSDEFFIQCKKQINVFNKVFSATPHMKLIRKEIVNICMQQDNNWFDPSNSCFEHRKQIMEFMILVLLRKNCKWVLDEKKKYKTRSKKLTHVTSS